MNGRDAPCVQVVVPVRRDAAAARRCVSSVLASPNRTRLELTVVASAGIARELGAVTAQPLHDPRVDVVVVADEVDYATLVNRALTRHPDRDVVLLQADAEVHGDWLDRLAFHAQGDAGVIGTFTNTAGSATYPRAGESNPLPPDATAASLDAVFAQANAGVAVDRDGIFGPCLYLTRACIAATGEFRPIGDADGHGSEIDWSLRAAEHGFRSRIAGNVFVGNDGEGAVGGRALAWRTHAATATLAGLHPSWHDTLQAYAARAPERALARRADLARLAGSTRPPVVFVAHGWGGGVRRHMNDLAALAAEHAEVLYLEPAGNDVVQLHWPRAGEAFAAWFALPRDLPVLAQTLRAIGTARLHYHHVRGLPRAILDLPSESAIAYDCTLHDYFAICPQYHLVDAAGRYCGEPDARGCAACLAGRPAQWPLDIASWRAAFEAFLRGAERLIAPSRDVATRIARYFPGLPIAVWSHPEREAAWPQRMTRVATLGNLTPEKGLRVVESCAQDARARGLPLAFRVLGATSEPIRQSPDVPLTLHGSYDEQALPELIAAERPDVLFFPAQVPETYSYTLSIALAASTPIVASALGALPERLEGHARARLLPFNATAAEWNDALLAAAGDLRASASPRSMKSGLPERASS